MAPPADVRVWSQPQCQQRSPRGKEGRKEVRGAHPSKVSKRANRGARSAATAERFVIFLIKKLLNLMLPIAHRSTQARISVEEAALRGFVRGQSTLGWRVDQVVKGSRTH